MRKLYEGVQWALGVRTTGSSPVSKTKKSINCFSQRLVSYPSANRISNFWTSNATTMRISRRASAFPTQFAGPQEKGMKAVVLCTSASPVSGMEFPNFASNHRSGQKVSGREKLFGSRCNTYGEMHTAERSGRKLWEVSYSTISQGAMKSYMSSSHLPPLPGSGPLCRKVGTAG